MAKTKGTGDNRQKIKLLKLYDLLRTRTDEQHPMVTHEICEELGRLGISCERRTLSSDMALLQEEGYEVLSCRVGHEKGYYMSDRSFSVPELKMLIDSVKASNSITEKKTQELIEKLASLSGTYRSEVLKGNLITFSNHKHKNESIYYNVSMIESAISEGKKIRFRYFDLDENGGRKYRKNGDAYENEPLALLYHEDNYYMIAYTAKHKSQTNYRVDRMDSVTLLEEPITEAARAVRESLPGYTDKVFKMFSGKLQNVTLNFAESLLGAVYDQFGEDAPVKRTTMKSLSLTVPVQVSDTFFGWLAQFPGTMEIKSPKSVREAYNEHARKIASVNRITL